MDLLSSSRKSIVSRAILLGFALIVFFDLFNNSYIFKAREIAPPEIQATSSLADISIGGPLRLRIPEIGVDAKIQQVAKTEKGNMAVPKNYTDVGWYGLGPKPGEKGNAVIAGHVDNGWGLKAVFYNLHKLKSGDLIYVDDDNGRQMTFRVIGSEIYDYKEAPLQKIFGMSGTKALNLITCAGTWVESEKTDDKRLVVFTEQIN